MPAILISWMTYKKRSILKKNLLQGYAKPVLGNHGLPSLISSQAGRSIMNIICLCGN